MGKLLLVDGHSILNRAFFGLPDLTNSKGEHTGAILGFLNILFKVMEDEKPDFLTVAFDVHAPTFRHSMAADYKGTRKPMAPELKEQVPRMQEVLKAMGVIVMTKEGFEADDILGTISRIGEKAGLDVSILSGDRDLLQLATNKVKICIPKTKKTGTEIEYYYPDDVKALYGVTPTEFIDVKALMGDSSDNIHGVDGIGEKTAGNIIAAYGSIENAYAHVDELKPPRASANLKAQYDIAVLAKKLATIEVNAPIEYNLDDAKINNLFNEDAYLIFKQYELKSLLKKFDSSAAESTKVAATMANLEVTRIDDFMKATELIDSYCNRATKQRLGLGISLIYDSDKAIKGLAIADGEIVKYIACFFMITEDYIRDAVIKLDEAGVILFMWNLKDTMHILGTKLKYAEDVSVMAYLLDPTRSEYTADLAASEFLNLMIPSVEELFGKTKLSAAIDSDHEAVASYAGYQAYTALATMPIMKSQIDEQGMGEVLRAIEAPLVYTLYDMEVAGIAMDSNALTEFGATLTTRITELEHTIYEKAGEEFNINSPKQLGVILFEKMGIEGAKKTKTGYSTAAEVLEELAVDNPIIADILEYRQLTKLNSTYVEGLNNCYEASLDGRIHSTFMQTVTATGRISSTEPNLQNIPIRMELGRQIRKVFLPKEGYCFLDADYSQIELRVLAHMSGDDALINAFREGKDIHRSTAALVFHTDFESVTDLQRRRAKAVNFGIVYGISAFGLARDIGCSRAEAKQYIDDYFIAYPKMKEFLDTCVSEAKEKGYATTLLGRRRPIPELKNSNFMQRSFGERVAMNSPIQGTAADIIKIAMVNVHDRLEREGLESRLILQVHDELLIETKLTEKSQVEAILSQEMENAAKLAVKLEIDMHSGNTWYEAK